MRKLTGIIIAAIFVSLCLSQVSHVFAKDDDKQPITSPITGPICKLPFPFLEDGHCKNKDKDHDGDDKHRKHKKHHKDHDKDKDDHTDKDTKGDK